MTFSSRFILALLVSAVALGTVARAQTSNDGLDLRFANGIAAIAEEKVITVDDVRREIVPLIPELQRSSRNEKEFNARLEQLQDDVIQELIDRVLIIKEFKKDEKKQIPASFIDNRIADILSEQFDNDRSKFLGYLRARGTTLREYRVEVQDDIIYNYMRQQQRKSQSVVSPVRIETFYRENKDTFFQDDAVHLRLIQLNRNEGETDDQLRVRLKEIIARFQAGITFEELAKEFSKDSRRSKGGDWGWQKRTDLKKEFSEPLFSLKKGEITPPLILPEGGFVLFAEDRRYAGVQPIDSVRDEIERQLVMQMARVSEARWLERLRRNGYVKHY